MYDDFDYDFSLEDVVKAPECEECGEESWSLENGLCETCEYRTGKIFCSECDKQQVSEEGEVCVECNDELL